MSITGSTTLDEIKQRVANTLNSINEGVKTMISDLDTLTSETISSMGTTRESVRALGVQFANALPSVAAMGGELKDIAAIQQGVGTELGRNNVLTADVV